MLDLNHEAAVAVGFVSFGFFGFLSITVGTWIWHIHDKAIQEISAETTRREIELEHARLAARTVIGPDADEIMKQAKAQEKLTLANERNVKALERQRELDGANDGS